MDTAGDKVLGGRAEEVELNVAAAAMTSDGWTRRAAVLATMTYVSAAVTAAAAYTSLALLFILLDRKSVV